MCFSATASFSASAVLSAISILMFKVCRPFNLRATISLLLPILLGLQQFSDGMVWLALQARNQASAQQASAFYYIILHIWPMYVVFFTLVNEPKDNLVKRRILCLLFVMSIIYTVWRFSQLYFYDELVYPKIIQHCVIYSYQGLFSSVSLEMEIWIYLFFCPFALFLTSRPSIRTFAVLLTLSLIVALVFFTIIFTSVWCFFAAILSLNMIFIERDLARHSC